MKPSILTVFNNKGGVGKTTLTYHLAQALGEMNRKTLLIDLDPQCNLTIFSVDMETIHDIWAAEDDFIDDFAAARNNIHKSQFDSMLQKPRSIHFHLKTTEDGTADLSTLPPTLAIGENVDLIPGRLTLHLFEAKVAERWSGIYQGDPLAIRTATAVRTLALEYAKTNHYEIVILDTSPSLGALNRNLLSLADGFIIPCSPDLFSVYGIRNIGAALSTWRRQFESIFNFISNSKRENFPRSFVKLIGYTLYNAKRRSDSNNDLGIAKSHFNYAQQIPSTIEKYVGRENIILSNEDPLIGSIGNNSIIYTHNTFPSMAQKYNMPMWKLPQHKSLEVDDQNTIRPNTERYEELRSKYHIFARDVLARVSTIHG